LAQHCWTISHHPTLLIPASAAGSDLLLTVKLIPFVSQPQVPHQRIGLSVNDQPVAQWLATEDEVQEFTARIPGAVATGNELLIGLDLPDAVIPRDLAQGGDERLLGVAMISLRIDMAEGIVPQGVIRD
jgi:hypothetical protein